MGDDGGCSASADCGGGSSFADCGGSSSYADCGGDNSFAHCGGDNNFASSHTWNDPSIMHHGSTFASSFPTQHHNMTCMTSDDPYKPLGGNGRCGYRSKPLTWGESSTCGKIVIIFFALFFLLAFIWIGFVLFKLGLFS